MTTSKTHTAQLHRFIAASGFSNLADGVAVVVWAWIASLLTRDPVLIALLPVALRIPWFVLALPAGIVTDRVDRRRLIIVMDLVRALAFATAAAVVFVSTPLPPPAQTGTALPLLFVALVACALIVGSAEVFRDNAAQTLLPAIVPHTHLERANGRLWSVELVGNSLLGPAFGAFLIASFIWLPFAVNALAFTAAVLLMLTVRGHFIPEKEITTGNWRSELKEGLVFLKNSPLLKLLAITTGVWNLLHQIIVIALVLHVQENLGLRAQGYGLMLAAGAVGGIAGGLLADRIIKPLGPGRAAQWMTFASAVAFMVMPFAPDGYILAVVLAAFEFTGIIWNTVSVSYRQRIIPSELLGRVNSIYRLLAWGTMPIGLLLSGIIVTFSEIYMLRSTALTMPFLAAACGALLLTVLVWKPLGAGFASTAAPSG